MKLDISSYDNAIDTLAKLKLRPYWDSTSGKAFFRSIKNKGFTKQKNKDWYKSMINALQLSSRERVKATRRILKDKKKETGAKAYPAGFGARSRFDISAHLSNRAGQANSLFVLP
ncbi:hypothetical protein ES703_125232 [subsurface metagenome]